MSRHLAIDVAGAATRLAPVLARTPTVVSLPLRAILKLETRQVTGSYKVRGALNALTAGVERGDRRAIVVASAGNHAAGIAWSARRLGLSALAVMPEGTPQNKVRRTADAGASVLLAGRAFEESLAFAQALAASERRRFVHAFDEAEVVAGQGTVGLELLRHQPDVVVVPLGGGGLAAGVAAALADTPIRVVAARVAPGDLHSTVADGARVARLGALTGALLERAEVTVLDIPESEIRHAIRRLVRLHGIVAEGAGALAVAALNHVGGRRRAAVVSGANIDAHQLRHILQENSHEARHARGRVA